MLFEAIAASMSFKKHVSYTNRFLRVSSENKKSFRIFCQKKQNFATISLASFLHFVSSQKMQKFHEKRGNYAKMRKFREKYRIFKNKCKI